MEELHSKHFTEERSGSYAKLLAGSSRHTVVELCESKAIFNDMISKLSHVVNDESLGELSPDQFSRRLLD